MTFSDKTMEMTDDEYNYSQESDSAAISEPNGASSGSEPENKSVGSGSESSSRRGRGRARKDGDGTGRGEQKLDVDSGSASDVPASAYGGTTQRGAKSLAKPEPTSLFDPKRMSKTGWKIDKRTSFETYEQQWFMIRTLDESIPWWEGDLAEFGEGKWGERYAQAVKETGHAQQTVMNRAFVSRHIPQDHRREELSFTHHAEVASMDLAVIDAMLEWAVVNRASVKGLREHVNEYKATVRGTPESQESVVAAPQADPDAEVVPEGTEAPETLVSMFHCAEHGYVSSRCCDQAVDLAGVTEDGYTEAVVIDVDPEPTPTTATKAAVDVAALYEKQGKLTRAQAIKFAEQHEREMVEDMGGSEPEWLGMYINWVLEAVQGIGPKHTAADAFAAGYVAGRGN